MFFGHFSNDISMMFDLFIYSLDLQDNANLSFWRFQQDLAPQNPGSETGLTTNPLKCLPVFFWATWSSLGLKLSKVCLSRIRLHKLKSALAMVHAALSSSNAWGWKLKWSDTSIAFYGTTNSNCKKLCAFNLAHNWYIQLIINPNLSSYWGSYSWLFPFPARVKTEQNCLRRRRTVHSHIL